ncbi:ECF-type sigma factor, partial [Acinetobacter baumannii]
MRSVIVDFARARRTERQGGNLNQVTLEILLSQQVVGPEDDALRIHEALDVLEKADARLARVVEMRYFG